VQFHVTLFARHAVMTLALRKESLYTFQMQTGIPHFPLYLLTAYTHSLFHNITIRQWQIRSNASFCLL